MAQTRKNKEKKAERNDAALLLEMFMARAICDANAQRVRESAEQIRRMKKLPFHLLNARATQGDPIALYALGGVWSSQTEDLEKRQQGLLYIEAAASMGVPQAQLSLAAYHIGMAATYGFFLPRVLIETINAWEKKHGELDQVVLVSGSLPEGPKRAPAPKPWGKRLEP